MNGSSSGFINKIIDAIPVELHIPGYQFCGSGTKVESRLARGDKGINLLDEACKEHDIIYNKYKDRVNRREADKVLIEKAWKRVKAKDASFGEKVAAWAVTNAMKAKVHLGMGGRLSRGQKRRIPFRTAVINPVLRELKRGNKISAYSLARRHIKRVGRDNIIVPRVISLPQKKKGGFLLPLISGLAALGGLIGAGSNIIKTVKDIHAAKDQLSEAQRHNRTMEAIAVGGGRLYVEPFKRGFGLRINMKKNFMKSRTGC